MRSTRTKTMFAAALSVAAIGASATAATAGGSYGGGGSWGGGGGYQQGQASSYINPDTGAATANPDVNANSSCFNPDRYDMQQFSTVGAAPAAGNRNVHNDACFLGRDGQKLDGPASFQSSGVGFISACPDPDGAGPKVAVNRDTNGDGRNDLCFQSGFQQNPALAAGDKEFHARLNNNGMSGRQTVVWCSDDDRNGCGDEWNKQTIVIDWSADGKASFGSDGGRWY